MISQSPAAEALLAAARDLPQGDDAVWEGRLIIWKEQETWAPALTAWLAPGRQRISIIKKLCDADLQYRREFPRAR
jgi:hypothetical protein